MCYRSRILFNKFDARGSGYKSERRFSKVVEITQSKSHYAVLCYSASPILEPIESLYDFRLMINTNLPSILHRFQVMVKFLLARGECLTLKLSLGVFPRQYFTARSVILYYKSEDSNLVAPVV